MRNGNTSTEKGAGNTAVEDCLGTAALHGSEHPAAAEQEAQGRLQECERMAWPGGAGSQQHGWKTHSASGGKRRIR